MFFSHAASRILRTSLIHCKTHNKPLFFSCRPRTLTSLSIMDVLHNSHTQSIDDLAATLKNIGLDVPKAPTITYPALNPVDIYRAHITELLAPISGVDPKVILPALQWTQTLNMGDLVLPVPALRVKGTPPAQ